jgi:hypothetical protein
MAVLFVPLQKIMQAVTTQEAVAVLPDDYIGRYVESTFYVVWNHTSGAGSVVVETAHSPSYTGTWANLATANWSAIDKITSISISGVYAAVRVRIATAVTSGAVDVWVLASDS